MNWMLREELSAALGAGTFELNCIEMRLHNPHNPALPEYCGPGIVRQSAHGTLEFRLFASRTFSHAEPTGIHAGDLWPKDAYHSLVVKDDRGRLWTAGRIIPRPSNPDLHSDLACVVCGNIWELHCEVPEKFFRTYRLTLDTFGEFELPCNRDTETVVRSVDGESSDAVRDSAEIELDECRILILNRERRLRVIAYSNGNPGSIEDRLIESLQFVLGRRVVWTFYFLESPEGFSIRVRQQRYEGNPSRLHPPLAHLMGLDWTGDFWRMFACYFRFLMKSPAARWHTFSRQLARAIDASGASFEAKGLTISVAVESVLNTLHKSGTPKCPKLKEAIDDLRSYFRTWPGIGSWDGEAEFAGRVSGLLSQLNTLSAKQRLRELAASGVVELEDVAAWSALRNSTAHGNDCDAEERQLQISRVDRVTGLLYKLILEGIGYSGHRTDYGTRGWPFVEFRATGQFEPEL